jgi:hypothetical protein
MMLAPNSSHYRAISVLAFSMIAVQILLSRICSVMFYYHFAFAGVTLAMLGLSAGALKVHSNPDRFAPSRAGSECAVHCLSAAIYLTVSTLILVDLSGRLFAWAKASGAGDAGAEAIILAASAVALYGFLKALIAMGVCITLLLTSFPNFTSKLYAADLASAAMACILVAGALQFLDPVSIVLLLASMLGITAWQFLGSSPRTHGVFRGAVIVLCLLFAGQSLSYLSGAPLFKVRVGKFALMGDLLFERWNTYSHVGIYPSLLKEPFGWGFGKTLDKTKYAGVEQYWLKIDADAGTVLTKFGGDTAKTDYLKHDVVNLGYHLRNVDHTAIIGVGGGRDVLSALTFNVPKITGIEINPAIFEALNGPFAAFTGNLATYPNVNLVNGEARSFINSHDQTFGMIQISLIDTWATTVAGGLGLSENKLYTSEAWREFLTHLNGDGMLTVSRWFIPGRHEGEFYRMLSLANAAISGSGPRIDARDHVLAASGHEVVTLALSKRPYTEAEISNFLDLCREYGFTPLMTPHLSYDTVSDTIISGKATNAFYASLPFDFSPPTDDKPFFFHMARFGDVLFQHTGNGYNKANNVAVWVLTVLALGTFFVLAYALLRPMAKLYRARKEHLRESIFFAAYFMCIGLGFMFVEMSMMQRLMIFLGHPVYGLCVILFTMLLFSGIGSYFAGCEDLRALICVLRPALLCVLLVVTAWLMPIVITKSVHFDTAWRIAISVLLLMPISFFMGMMFPLGIAAAKKRQMGLLPWFWALNGVASVFASIASVVLSMNFGIGATLAAGIVCYVPCLFIGLHLRMASAARPALAAA